MNAVLSACCGLDVHKKFVTACLLTTGASGRVTKEQRQFGTTTTVVLPESLSSFWAEKGG